MQKILPFAVAALLSATVFAAGEVYRWKDSNGTWHYSDQPQPGAELIRTIRRPPGANSSSAPTPRTSAANSSPPRSFPVSGEVAQSVRQEAADAKVEQCKKAEEAYQKAVRARRIFKTDEQGNRTFLSDAEIDSARLEARGTRDLACGG
jgi:hypothetical protein